MPKLIDSPTEIDAEGDKTIREYVGRVNSNNQNVSLAHMKAPAGWSEPGQQPEFTEYTLVLSGTLLVEHESGEFEVGAGQAVVSEPGEWVRYSTPKEGGAEYIAVCLPAFGPELVNRDVPEQGE